MLKLLIVNFTREVKINWKMKADEGLKNIFGLAYHYIS
jgi:hypothetical protein